MRWSKKEGWGRRESRMWISIQVGVSQLKRVTKFDFLKWRRWERAIKRTHHCGSNNRIYRKNELLSCKSAVVCDEEKIAELGVEHHRPVRYLQEKTSTKVSLLCVFAHMNNRKKWRVRVAITTTLLENGQGLSPHSYDCKHFSWFNQTHVN